MSSVSIATDNRPEGHGLSQLVPRHNQSSSWAPRALLAIATFSQWWNSASAHTTSLVALREAFPFVRNQSLILHTVDIAQEVWGWGECPAFNSTESHFDDIVDRVGMSNETELVSAIRDSHALTDRVSLDGSSMLESLGRLVTRDEALTAQILRLIDPRMEYLKQNLSPHNNQIGLPYFAKHYPAEVTRILVEAKLNGTVRLAGGDDITLEWWSERGESRAFTGYREIMCTVAHKSKLRGTSLELIPEGVANLTQEGCDWPSFSVNAYSMEALMGQKYVEVTPGRLSSGDQQVLTDYLRNHGPVPASLQGEPQLPNKGLYYGGIIERIGRRGTETVWNSSSHVTVTRSWNRINSETFILRRLTESIRRSPFALRAITIPETLASRMEHWDCRSIKRLELSTVEVIQRAVMLVFVSAGTILICKDIECSTPFGLKSIDQLKSSNCRR
jgi:hypothetical protein